MSINNIVVGKKVEFKDKTMNELCPNFYISSFNSLGVMVSDGIKTMFINRKDFDNVCVVCESLEVGDYFIIDTDFFSFCNRNDIFKVLKVLDFGGQSCFAAVNIANNKKLHFPEKYFGKHYYKIDKNDNRVNNILCNRVNMNDIDDMIKNADIKMCTSPNIPNTVVFVCTLKNGFIMTESYIYFSETNDNYSKAKKYCLDKFRDRLSDFYSFYLHEKNFKEI